ncbi:M20/M25/M40 family metallo-hydrolase [Pseudonocardiaceae bacterium YIM PH 21723]|nr:M20/M25/M40 family metallo-hydrolase [Pseudonocardiaceae bacterium YIM PH 21723]
MDNSALTKTVAQTWDNDVLPSLSEYVRIPALSPAFDADWVANGQLDAAIEHLKSYLSGRNLTGATLEVIRLEGRTPVLLVDVPATPGAEAAGTVLLYGHLDKQPPVGGWGEGLDPWTPVIRDGRLFGRGSVDDGYAGYAASAALEAIQAHGGAHARSVILLETSEESGSPDLPAYIEHLSDRLGAVSLVVCLDSGAGDYERMWLTTSLRGLAQVHVEVKVLDGGQHSGAASGVVPSSFRVLRQLLDRIEDSVTGEIKLPELNTEVPADRLAETTDAAALIAGELRKGMPFAGSTQAVTEDDLQLVLNRTWRPTLSVIGADGFPKPADAGNVLRPSTTLCLGFRLPPTVDANVALDAVKKAVSTEVPYGATVTLRHEEAAGGFNAPSFAPWLREAMDGASADVFGQPWRTLGEGGSIPFMGLLADKYPQAQFVVTGALGPGSNAHVPDESLHLDFAAKVTAAVAVVLDAHARSAS